MIDLSNVTEGMDVRDSAGHKLGKVAAVQTTMIGGSGLDTGGVTDVAAGTTPNTYVRVENGKTLWVPATQISGVDDDGVHLECERRGCEAQYQLEPPGLS